MEDSNRLGEEPIPRLIAALSAPAVLSLLCNSVNMVVDRAFVAQGAGTAALSAVTVAYGLYLVMQASSQLVGGGAASVVALRQGEGDGDGARRAVGNALLLSAALAAAIALAGTLLADPLLRLYGATGENVGLARDYAGVMFAGAPCFVLAQSANSVIRGMGRARRAFANLLSSIAVNVALGALFVLSLGWGVRGAALAMVAGNLVCAALAVAFLFSKRAGLGLGPADLAPSRRHIGPILSVGASGFVAQLALSLVTLVFARVCSAWGGSTAVAAYGAVSTVLMLVYMPLIGLGQGIQPIVGFNYGGGRMSRASQAAKRALLYATAFCVAMFVVLEAFAPQIVAALGGSGDPAFSEAAVEGLRTYALMTPVVGMQMVGANLFQYIGKARLAVLLSALRQVFLLVPLALLLPLAFGMAGVWAAAPVSDGVAFAATIALVARELAAMDREASDPR